MNKLIAPALFTIALAFCSSVTLARGSADGGDKVIPDFESEAIPAGSTARYIVTYMNSQTTANFRSASVVSVSNQSPVSCSVTVEYFKGFVLAPVCTSTAVVGAGVTHDFCSRAIPGGATTCNSTCNPSLVFDEGYARVASAADLNGKCANIAVDARLYHLAGTTTDTGVAAIGSPNVVRIGQGNAGN